MGQILLSKSTYLRGLQCEKSLYLYKYHQDLRDEPSEHQQAIFSQGTSIGELAHNLFPGGINCQPDPFYDFQSAIQNTRRKLNHDTPIIYEAGFEYDGVFVYADILAEDEEGWKVYEVKSSTSVKSTYITDATLQSYIIKNSGIDLKDISIIHIDNSYVKHGAIEINKLFKTVSVLEEANELIQEIQEKIEHLKKTLTQDMIPANDIGPHCDHPYPCDFKGHCWKDVPKDTVFEISNLRENRKFELYDKGITLMKDVPEDFKLSAKQLAQIEGVRNGSSHVDRRKIDGFVNKLKYPLHFLDFETINPAVPIYDNSRPYQQLVFQYSLHIQESVNDEIVHKEFLAETDGTDPRINFMKQLIKDCEEKGDILVYNIGFERGKLQDLARLFPSFKKELNKIITRLKDLMTPFQKGWYYTPEMHGSYSIKSVLPAIDPELTYGSLKIQDGGTASNIYETMATGNFDGDYEKTRKDLLEYCKMDTWAMVRILEKLR